MIDRTRAHDTHHALEQVEPPVEERGGREHRGLELGLFHFVVFWVVLWGLRLVGLVCQGVGGVVVGWLVALDIVLRCRHAPW